MAQADRPRRALARGVIVAMLLALGAGTSASAIDGTSCEELPGHGALLDALIGARSDDNGGFGLEMWGAIVNRDGIVCAVAFTGADRGEQWPGSRVIPAQKTNTANAFSLPALALSTASLFAPARPEASL
jgi:hypothetical protein